MFYKKKKKARRKRHFTNFFLFTGPEYQTGIIIRYVGVIEIPGFVFLLLEIEIADTEENVYFSADL